MKSGTLCGQAAIVGRRRGGFSACKRSFRLAADPRQTARREPDRGMVLVWSRAFGGSVLRTDGQRANASSVLYVVPARDNRRCSFGVATDATRANAERIHFSRVPM